jgi:hypothetical protein
VGGKKGLNTQIIQPLKPSTPSPPKKVKNKNEKETNSMKLWQVETIGLHIHPKKKSTT